MGFPVWLCLGIFRKNERREIDLTEFILISSLIYGIIGPGTGSYRSVTHLNNFPTQSQPIWAIHHHTPVSEIECFPGDPVSGSPLGSSTRSRQDWSTERKLAAFGKLKRGVCSAVVAKTSLKQDFVWLNSFPAGSVCYYYTLANARKFYSSMEDILLGY